jgi:hypothetical protein
MRKEWERGFAAGYAEAHRQFGEGGLSKGGLIEYAASFSDEGFVDERFQKKPKRKVKQSPKQKLLTQMTKKKWDKYKKGRGRKTYVQIRSEVSRSQAFKKKAKRL